MPRSPQLLYLLEPTRVATGLSGQHLRQEQEHQTFGWVRELRQQERFDGTSFTQATVEIRLTRLAAPRMTADWRIRDQYGVIYRVEAVAPSDNRIQWVVQAWRDRTPWAEPQAVPLLLEDGTPLLLEDASGGGPILIEEAPVI